MSVYFNGRLWTTPVVASAVNDSAMVNTSLGLTQTLVIIGPSTGGAPLVPLTFSSAAQAAAVLRSGDLLDAITNAFSPSNDTGGPSSIIGMRVQTPSVLPANLPVGTAVGTCSQSTLMLSDSLSANVIQLNSVDYGFWNNQIQAKVAAGTTNGLMLSLQYGTTVLFQDNIYDAPFNIVYSGSSATATVAITNANMTLTLATGSPVVIPLASYPTVQQLIAYINTLTGFTATLLTSNEGLEPTVNALDTLVATSCKTTALAITATLQAAVNWFNSAAAGGLVTAIRQASAGTLPAVIGWTSLAGGSDGTTTTQDYQNAYNAMQAYSAQIIVPASNVAAIHAMNDAHCQYMSSVMLQERRSFCGMALATTDALAAAEAFTLNSDRTSLCHIGIYNYNAAGTLTLYQPFIAAAMIAGIFAAVSPGTPATNKSLNIRGLERILQNPSNTDPLINAGILCYTQTDTGFRVVKSITTWLTNTKFNRVEVSTGFAVDYLTRTCRSAAKSIIGTKGNPVNLAQAVENVHTALTNLAVNEPQGPGVLAGDKNSPPFLGLTGSQTGDVIAISFQASPVIPNNYVLITVYATPYSGSVSIASGS